LLQTPTGEYTRAHISSPCSPLTCALFVVFAKSGSPVRLHVCPEPSARWYGAAVVAADALIKRDVFRLPDPFAVITVNSEQTNTTSVIKKTLNPYWNENFDMYVFRLCQRCTAHRHLLHSDVTENSVIAVQIFDQRKFKKRDQGFLGVVNIRVGDVLDLDLDSHGQSCVLLVTHF
jgi:E3 ubiquitin-protein ligase NEDD4